jgi:ribosomal protein S6--L-glutamate ligase
MSRFKRQIDVAFLLGKPVKQDTMFPELFQQLEKSGARVSVHLPNHLGALPESIAEADLVVQRGLNQAWLRDLSLLEASGLRFCNRVDGTITASNREEMYSALLSAGLPVPVTIPAASWENARELASSLKIVIKSRDASMGRGKGVLAGEPASLPAIAPFDGPFIVQQRIESNGAIVKAYVAGRSVRGLVKSGGLPPTDGALGREVRVDRELYRLAQDVGTALGLEIYGVDFIYGPRGPMIIDVNPFPGFRGVRQAADLVAAHLESVLLTESMTGTRAN